MEKSYNVLNLNSVSRVDQIKLWWYFSMMNRSAQGRERVNIAFYLISLGYSYHTHILYKYHTFTGEYYTQKKLSGGLWRLCGGHVEALWRLCGGPVEALWRLCGGPVEALWRVCGDMTLQVIARQMESFFSTLNNFEYWTVKVWYLFHHTENLLKLILLSL